MKKSSSYPINISINNLWTGHLHIIHNYNNKSDIME